MAEESTAPLLTRLQERINAAFGRRSPSGVVASQPTFPRTLFNFNRIEPPNSTYVGIDDVIHIDLYNNTTTTQFILSGSILRTDGQVIPFRERLVSTSIGTRETFRFRLNEGFVLSASVTSLLAAIARGRCYVVMYVEHIRGASGEIYAPLANGYIVGDSPVGWPQTQPIGNQHGRGFIEQVNIPAPPAGSNFTITTSYIGHWRLLGLVFTFTSSAAAATRFVYIRPVRNNISGPFIVPSEGQTASLSRFHNFMLGMGYGPVAAVDSTYTASLPDILLTDADSWESVTTAIQAGDAYTSVRAITEHWIQEAL